MSKETKSCCATGGSCATTCRGKAALGVFLIVAGLVWLMIYYTRPATPTDDRAELRRKNLAELRATNAEALNNYAWLDQSKGIVRLPVEQAMKLAVAEWQNPAAARAKLIAREEASAAPVKK